MRLIFLVLLLFVGDAQAQNYKCIENGKILLTDQPCQDPKKSSQGLEEVKTAAQIQKEFEQEVATRKALEAKKIDDIKKAQEENEANEQRVKLAIKNGPRRAEVGALSIRAAMRDPDSFKLETARVVSTSGTVCYSYRSKNAFGGYVSGLAILLSTEFDVMLSSSEGFNNVWARECLMKEGINFAAAISRFSY